MLPWNRAVEDVGAVIAMPESVFELTSDALASVLQEGGEKPYRAAQILRWVYDFGVRSYDDMTDLPSVLRAKLTECLPLYTSEVVADQRASDGTVKLLLRWPDDTTSECVMIPDGGRRTVCLSSQVGCPVGCLFCASGLDGLQRNLTAGQIVEQALRVRFLGEAGSTSRVDGGLTNVVFMGLGEPLANYENVLKALRTINASWGLGVGARKITLSTVGLPDQMRRLADEELQVTLALSLHAPTDELRGEIIPWAKRVKVSDLVGAASYYFQRTGREVTLEYILLGGVNDEPKHASELAKVSKRMRSNVNLIPYNPVEGLAFDRPDEGRVRGFLSTLRGLGVNAHLRRSRGMDIDAACGQLRRRALTV